VTAAVELKNVHTRKKRRLNEYVNNGFMPDTEQRVSYTVRIYYFAVEKIMIFSQRKKGRLI